MTYPAPPGKDPLYTARGVDTGGVWNGARIVNIVLGVWLFISAFLWPHNPASQTNTWLLGVIIAVVGVAGLFTPPIRWVNTAAAIWLFLSTLFINHDMPGTVWNNLIVAILVFILSLTASRTGSTLRT